MVKNWKQKLTEGSTGDIYWMVDWNAAGEPHQVRVPAIQVRFAHSLFRDMGNLSSVRDSWEHKAALERLFKAVDPEQMTAFLAGKEWVPTDTNGLSRVHTSVTGGGVELSGFRLLDEDASSLRGENLYVVTNKRTGLTVNVRAASADQAVERAMAKKGPSAFGFPMIVQNLHTNRAAHIMNDTEYDAKIGTIDAQSTLSLQPKDDFVNRIQHGADHHRLNRVREDHKTHLGESAGLDWVYAAYYATPKARAQAREAGIFVEQDGHAPTMSDSSGPDILNPKAPAPTSVWLRVAAADVSRVLQQARSYQAHAYDIHGDDEDEERHGIVRIDAPEGQTLSRHLLKHLAPTPTNVGEGASAPSGARVPLLEKDYGLFHISSLGRNSYFSKSQVRLPWRTPREMADDINHEDPNDLRDLGAITTLLQKHYGEIEVEDYSAENITDHGFVLTAVFHDDDHRRADPRVERYRVVQDYE